MAGLIALVDGSLYSQSVCDHAAWMAQRTGMAVELLHVIGRRETPSAPANLSGAIALGARTTLLNELSALDEQRAKLSQQRGRAILDDAKARIEAAGIADVRARLRIGDIVATVAEAEADADMVMLGKRGEAADFAKLHLGSNLERVLRGATRPVLVSARAFRPVKRFLVAFDGGPSVAKALDHLVASPLLKGAACELLMVSDKTSDPRLDRAVETLNAAGYDATGILQKGEPDAVIAAHVERDEIDLIVMGAYGHSRIRSYFIGSTTSEIVRSCLRPVLMFR